MSALPKDTVVGVIGAGVMGSGIAQVAASAGHTVHVFDTVDGAAAAAHTSLALTLNKLVGKGKLHAHEAGAIGARIKPVASLVDLASAGLIIEAIIEDSEAKHKLFERLEEIVEPGAIITSNTSSLSITKLAAEMKRPDRFAGLHFFNPAPLMSLVEVVAGVQSGERMIADLVYTMREWNKDAVLVKDAPGFVVNRGARCFYGEPLKFVEEQGADFATTDALMKSLGFKMGPIELIDLVGLDINLAASRSMYESSYQEPRYKPSALVAERVAAGRFGKKSAQGFYTYKGDPAPKVAAFPQSNLPPPVDFYGDFPGASQLLQLAKDADIHIDRGQGDGFFTIGNLKLAQTDGRMAAERGANWALFDLNLDWASASVVALTTAPGTDMSPAAGFFQKLGKQVVQVADLPGMLCAKTICMLINEACETMLKGIASKQDIDLAMKKGLNWPGGPFEWLDKLGADYCVRVLDNMMRNYGDPRYRASIILRQMALAESKNG